MSQPHDAFFKLIFSEPAEVAALLRDLLPAEITDRLHLEEAKQLPTEGVAEDLSARHADLRFVIPWRAGGALDLILVLEHQSSPDPQMPLRALRYTLQAWESAARGDQRLPVVLTFVIFHGPRPWTTARALSDLLDAPPEALSALRAYLPELRLNLVDLTVTPDDEVPGQGGGRLALLLMRHAHGPNLWDTLEDNVPDYRALYVQRGDIPTRGVLRYITQVTEPAPTQSLRAQIRRQINPKLEDELMSWADRLLAEGRQEERAHSRVVLARSVENLVKLRFGPPSDWALSKIRAAELSTLERWSDEILTTTSLEALLSEESPSASASRDVT
ncbi:MAG: hypothetical protein RIT28_2410 [Pseudomonadota bacterium]